MRMPRLNQYTPSLMTTRNTFMGAGPGYYGSAPLSGAGPSTFMGAGPGYYGQSIPNTGRPIIPYAPSPDASIDYTNEPKTSWFDKLDPQALEDVAGLASPQRQQGKVLPAPGINRGGKQGGGGGIPLSQPSEYTFAPNPGFGLVLSSREKDRFSGTS